MLRISHPVIRNMLLLNLLHMLSTIIELLGGVAHVVDMAKKNPALFIPAKVG